MKRFIVACGNGIATSQTVALKVKKLLAEKGIKVNVDVVDIRSIDTHIKNCNGYIAITKPRKEYPVPVFNGIAFLTGVGMDAELQKIIDTAKQ